MIYVKTEAGRQVIKDRSVPLAPRQRAALILCDGKHSVVQVLAATSAMGVTVEDLQHMSQLGLLQVAPDLVAQAAVADAAISQARGPQQRYEDAYPIAASLTAGLGLRGFRLNLAVEGATSYETLAELAPKIREAVGPEKYAPLEKALNS
jgi:hypothetical protein